MRTKSIAIYQWNFPFPADLVWDTKLFVRPGVVRWRIPKNLLGGLPEQMPLLYTNLPTTKGQWLIISASEADLVALHRSVPNRRTIFPNTDGGDQNMTLRSETGYLMKRETGNLALMENMNAYKGNHDLTIVTLNDGRVYYLVLKGTY